MNNCVSRSPHSYSCWPTHYNLGVESNQNVEFGHRGGGILWRPPAQIVVGGGGIVARPAESHCGPRDREQSGPSQNIRRLLT